VAGVVVDVAFHPEILDLQGRDNIGAFGRLPGPMSKCLAVHIWKPKLTKAKKSKGFNLLRLSKHKFE
jgi:hypothetical protein